MIDGKENHLVKLVVKLDKRCPEYKPPAKEAPMEIVKKKKREETKKQIFQRLQIEKETEKTINSKNFFVFLTQKHRCLSTPPFFKL